MEKNLADSVSIIVPIYHGKKYISKLVEMAEVCKEKAGVQVKVELILSNDDPDACIEDGYFSELVDIRVLNTEVNRGIQGARIRGSAGTSTPGRRRSACLRPWGRIRLYLSAHSRV